MPCRCNSVNGVFPGEWWVSSPSPAVTIHTESRQWKGLVTALEEQATLFNRNVFLHCEKPSRLWLATKKQWISWESPLNRKLLWQCKHLRPNSTSLNVGPSRVPVKLSTSCMELILFQNVNLFFSPRWRVFLWKLYKERFAHLYYECNCTPSRSLVNNLKPVLLQSSLRWCVTSFTIGFVLLWVYRLQ